MPRTRTWPLAVFAALLVAALAAAPDGRDGAPPPPQQESAPQTDAPRAPDTQPARPDEPDSRLVSGLLGSKHDFTAGGAEPRDLCLPCHTPHMTRFAAPLVDRGPAATQPVRPYQSLSVELDNASLLCLSCHDGIVATDVYSRAHATALSAQLGASSLGASVLRSHPVGVKYPLNDPTYHPPAAVTSDGRIRLPDGRVQCTSCHDPHNAERHEGLLVKSNRRSALCLSCHRL